MSPSPHSLIELCMEKLDVQVIFDKICIWASPSTTLRRIELLLLKAPMAPMAASLLRNVAHPLQNLEVSFHGEEKDGNAEILDQLPIYLLDSLVTLALEPFRGCRVKLPPCPTSLE